MASATISRSETPDAPPNANPSVVSILSPIAREPIRAELYGLEALEADARQLAQAYPVCPHRGREGPMLQRLAHNQRVLLRIHRRIVEAVRRDEVLTPDAEWLLDNFYVIEEVLREVRHDLPRSYYRELPKLAAGPLAGYPRIYALALLLIAHTDSSLDEDHIIRLVQAYQTVTPLTIGEVWAVPTMLRLGLLENLRRLAEQMLDPWDDRRQAEVWVAPLQHPHPTSSELPPLPDAPSDSFLVRAGQLLRDYGPPTALEALKNALLKHDIQLSEVIRRENQRQALNQVSVGNCVTSLRLLAALDWAEFFERTNAVGPVLREDPAGAYPAQDFATRDRYRLAVEKLAKRSTLSEVEVARRAVQLARRSAAKPPPSDDVARATHVGYYLIDRGNTLLRTEVGYRPTLQGRLFDAVLAHPQFNYFGSTLALGTLFLIGVGWLASGLSTGPWLLVLLSALWPVAELAVGIVNGLVTLFVPPRVLPKLDFKDGIPAEWATVVVMPSMLVRPQSATSLLERLEIHYLANPDPQLRFALLTDFADAPAEQQPEDDDFVRAALTGVEALNRRYAPEGPPRFFLFHRRRLWNPVEGCWMGWERKRGKLAEFNRLVRGDRTTSYSVCSGDAAQLANVRFVITLDVDTRLPRDTARRLVGTLAHPLNRPWFDAHLGRITQGYAILQPRISFHITAAAQSLFSSLWAASAGLDPYATAVSDVYQDLFGAGSFTGKGIYDLDAFEAATGQAFPDNHILSHDLIEGNLARCGLVTDVELYDDFPARYHAYARREHRWIRGDWQLLPWLGRRVPMGVAFREGEAPAEPTMTPAFRESEAPAEPTMTPAFREGEAPAEPTMTRSPARQEPRPPSSGSDAEDSFPPPWRPNPLPLLERWKVLDNLRRSLLPPALVLWLVLTWTVLPVPWWLGTGLALVILALPLLLQVANTLVHSVRGFSWAPCREFRKSAAATLAQTLLGAVFLLNQACLSVDAVVRTLVRVYLTRRRLLEWETAAAAERRLGAGIRDFWRSMWHASALAAGLALFVAWVRPDALAAASLFLVPWLLSPLVACWVSQPRRVAEKPLEPAERQELRRIARKTWGFFETFVGDEDHWLPPDNFQEEPRPQVAHRTSPTNQGFLLLSTLSAHDLGYLSWNALLTRVEKTFDSLDRLDRHRGHFYNWYDTRTLLPLQPAYVSTVDSGNLMGCLLTLKQGLLGKVREPIVGPALVAGLTDTLGLVAEVLRGLRLAVRLEAVTAGWELEETLTDLNAQLQLAPIDFANSREWLARLAERAAVLPEQARQLVRLLGSAGQDLEVWATRFAIQVRAQAAELNEICAGFDRATDPPAAGGRSVPALTEAPTGSAGERLLQRSRRLAERADALAASMDFRFLYKPDRHLFAIGYNVAQGRLDTACYDLLASEARLTSFLCVARGDVPHKHWFHLGRLVVQVGSRMCLVSWGGTMFEYLMPELMLRRYPGTLLAESCQAAVARQIAYSRECGVPWGISESAFSSQYINLDYQYQAFGVPGLGLKRGLAQDLVVAPYATALASIVRPRDALANFRRLAAVGAAGRYGFYEAVDYTRSRMPEGRSHLVVRCYMAHHQGMSLVALANCILDEPMPRRLLAEPLARATELLLQEKVPAAASPVQPPEHEELPRAADPNAPQALSRRLTTPFTAWPRTHLLSNGRTTVMVTNAGGGYSRCSGMAVTRWREDATRDDSGQFLYIRDLQTGQLWSAAYHPVGSHPEQYEVLYSPDKAEFRRLDGSIATHLEITVCPEFCGEVRRVTLLNHDRRPHELELTTYAEIVLAPHAADRAHPAFTKLFLETEWVPSHGALLCRRRPRASEEPAPWAVHVATITDFPDPAQYETDRARFLGRGRTPTSPAALQPGAVLSNTTGAVLDPIFSLRRRVRVEPGAAVSVTFCTAVAGSRAEALALADHYRDPQAALRVFDLAWAHSQIELRHLRMTTQDAHLYQRLASHLLYVNPSLRAAPGVLAANRHGQEALWRHGISGDRPILLVRIAEAEEMPLVRQLLVAHAYLRLKGLEVDLAILCEEATTYHDGLFQSLQELIRNSDSTALADRPGGIFVRKLDHLSEEERTLLEAAARVVLLGHRGSLAAQLGRRETPAMRSAPVLSLADASLFQKGGIREGEAPAEPVLPRSAARQEPRPPTSGTDSGSDRAGTRSARLPQDLAFFNGLGGFGADGREYVIRIQTRQQGRRGEDGLSLPPQPWINVIANPCCGSLVSESGLGCTWAGNSQLNRLTPWSNDPVADSPGEVVYLRDEDSGQVWTPTPRPRGSDAPTLVRHGQGYTQFERHSHELTQEVLVFVPLEDPLKLILVKVRNNGTRRRRLSATFYAEWVLGANREQALTWLRTEVDPHEGSLLARNPSGMDFGTQVAFADVNVRPLALTGDRTEFLGRNGSTAAPAALARTELSGRTGPDLDPCAVLQVRMGELGPSEEKEVVFMLGSAADVDSMRQLVRRYKEPGRARAALDEVRGHWERLLTTVQVRTPDPALDLMVNRWLLYQVLSCRVWGRSAFYQSGGAYGFRDQLQDVLALVHAAPAEARTHLVRAAARQFREGDVQHWWHPPSGRGVRTRISDDFLWLPFAVCHYVTSTGDTAVLDEVVAYLHGPRLQPGQEEDYGQPAQADESGSLYDHCVRALRNGLHFGNHGLPLMGTGDWNDGMNRVGAAGKGETVWGGWFLLTCLRRFVTLAEARGDQEWAGTCNHHAELLRRALEEHAWDGGWYRRAYFDDGTPLGTAQGDECQIDSIAQSWAVISGAGEPERVRRAMAAVQHRLVRSDARLILLFTPPFDAGALQPGYVKGYVPGIRENGGQYTHAAVWVVQAAALLGEGTLAGQLFDLLNPVRQAATVDGAARYRVEPYVVAGDVYGVAPHTGRGGWTWYTGSASWMYRVALEQILGFQRHGDHLTIDPCIPRHWPEFEIAFRFGSTDYRIAVTNPGRVERGVRRLLLDGQPHESRDIALFDDGQTHRVEVILG